MNEVREKKRAVYLFLGFMALYFGGWMVTNFVQAAQNGRGTGFNDTNIVSDPGSFFEREDIGPNSR